MTNEEKAKELCGCHACKSESEQKTCQGCHGYHMAIQMAVWKDEQYNKKLNMILNAPNEVLRIEWLQALINHEL